MANHTHSSSGGGGFQVDIDISDFTEEISEGIKAAIHRAAAKQHYRSAWSVSERNTPSNTFTTALTTWSCALRIPCTHLSSFAVNRKMLRSLAGPFSFWAGRFSVRII